MSTHNLPRRKIKSKPRRPEIKIQFTDSADGEMDVFMFADGVKIAKRGRPESLQAKTWISLEPGWRVLDRPDYSGFVIECNGVRIQ
jgi:hypothetical protein